MDDRLLARIDHAVTRRGLTRSSYLAGLAERDLGIGSGPGADPSVRAALQTLQDLFSDAPRDESTEVVRRSRGRS